MLKLADVAATVHHNQQLPAEIVKTLKQNFKPPEQFVHFENKVQIRTDQHYRPDKGEHAWREIYDRHVMQKSSGFYTPSHIPYESVGEVVLDLRDLVDGSLKKLTQSPKQTVKLNTWKKFKVKPTLDKAVKNYFYLLKFLFCFVVIFVVVVVCRMLCLQLLICFLF